MYHVVHRDSAIGQEIEAGGEPLSVFPNFDHERFSTAAEAQDRCKGTECVPVFAAFSGQNVKDGPNSGVMLWRIRRA